MNGLQKPPQANLMLKDSRLEGWVPVGTGCFEKQMKQVAIESYEQVLTWHHGHPGPIPEAGVTGVRTLTTL